MIEQKQRYELSKSRNLENLLRLLSQLPGHYAVYVTDGNGNKGSFQYSDNLIVSASCHNLNGKQALREMFSWEDAVCQLEELKEISDKNMEVALGVLLEGTSIESPYSKEPATLLEFRRNMNSVSSKPEKSRQPIDITPEVHEEMQQILKMAVRNLDGLVLACVTTMTGVPVVNVNFRGDRVRSFAEVSSYLMSTIEESLRKLDSGGVAEYMVGHRNGWLLSHTIGSSRYCLILAVKFNGSLGIVRLMAKRIVDGFVRFLKV
jgi:predicted regulator of Ras-like GTPase activity (Roadblock/LC7/MglB family)